MARVAAVLPAGGLEHFLLVSGRGPYTLCMQTEDVVIALLGVIALAAGAACVWLAMARGRALAERAAAEAGVARLTEDLARERGVLEALRREAAERGAAMQGRLDELGAEVGELEVRNATLREQHQAMEERSRVEREGLELRRADLERKHEELSKRAAETFKALAGEALSASTRDFLKLAVENLKSQQQAGSHDLELRRRAVEELVKPIGETLRKADERLGAIEKQREASFATLAEQLRAVSEASGMLKQETGKLVSALRKPQVRGRYGEVQLRRVAEVAGMRGYCDFSTQESVRDWDGKLQRPDMTVKLPNDRVVVIDAKTNIEAYIDALEAPTPAEADAALDRFAGHVADQVGKLAAKTYWDQFEKTPEFVVMFVPGDQFIDAALARRPELFELAASKRVILASPSTLIGLLRAVELGWKEQKLAEEAKELRRLGEELHERAAKVWELAGEIGECLGRTVKKYNEFAGSVEGRLTPTLRKFEEAGVRSAKALPSPAEVVVVPRLLDVGVKGEGV